MRRILRRVVQRDSRGAVIHEYAELTVDTGRDIGVFTVETFQRCESCGRSLKPDDARGICRICRRGICSCAVECDLCRASLCHYHSAGIISGQARLTVCPICLPKAERALALARELAIESSKAQLLHSSLLDRLPGIGVVRQLGELKLLGTLDQLKNEMRR